MKIGLISDTHGVLDEKVFHYFREVDEVWHAGDIGNMDVVKSLEEFKPLRAVYGNIDGAEIRRAFPEHQIFVIENLKVWMTHIGGYPPKYLPAIRRRMSFINPGLFISGHSHILKIMPDSNNPRLLHINPGAAGTYGFHIMKTIVRFEVLGGKIRNLEVIELGKRAKIQ